MTKDKTTSGTPTKVEVDELVRLLTVCAKEKADEWAVPMLSTIQGQAAQVIQSQETTLNLYRREVKANNKSMIAAGDKIKSQQKRIEELEELMDATIELLAVAEMRGDDELPHPADDPQLWTARMQDAWSDLRDHVESIRPDAIYEEVKNSNKVSK